MSQIKHHVALVQENNVVGVTCLDSDGILNIVNIITTPLVRLDRMMWVMDQHGNKLSKGPEGVKLNTIETYSLVFVSMQEALAENLGMKWDSSLIFKAKNYTLWTGGNLATNFPGTDELRMVLSPVLAL